VLLAVEASQATIGWVQYFTHVPIVLVMFHMLGAALVSAAMTWALLATREPHRMRRESCVQRTAPFR